MSKIIIIVILFIFCYDFAKSQEINPDGYNTFYHPNGTVSSEGYMRDGQPDGYWKNYYENGILMSEGNRLFFQLDSIWKFYDSEGNLTSTISYRNNEKNGYVFTYNFYYTEDSSKVYYLSSKELYYMGLREGLSYYYDKNEKLKYTFTYKSDSRNGDGKEYDETGLVVTLFKYYNGYQIEALKINRRDGSDRKQGLWMEFYPGGAKQTEANYLDDELHGIYREYDLAGNTIYEQRYMRGLLYTPQEEDEIVLKAEIKKTFYSDGKLQYEGAFVDNTPVGIHKEFNPDGKLKINKEYNSEGILFGEGFFDDNGKRTGKWKLYDPYYNYFYGEGNFANGLKDGFWKFYYSDGSVEQEGYFSEDIPDREWVWYYRNGNRKLEEEYLMGKLEGKFAEYDSSENVILSGEYFDDVRVGPWYYKVGYIKEEGAYEYGEKNGEWIQLYNTNEKKYFAGAFRNGEEDGTHMWYYPNGVVYIMGDYRNGRKNKDWKVFNEDGTLHMTFTYKNDILVKINGKKTYQEKDRKKANTK